MKKCSTQLSALAVSVWLGLGMIAGVALAPRTAHAAQSGQLELNAFLPLIAHALLGALAMLDRTNTMFRERCITGLIANRERCAEFVELSWTSVTALVPTLGYETAADVAREAQTRRATIREVVLARGLLEAAQLDQLLSADAMTALGHRSPRP